MTPELFFVVFFLLESFLTLMVLIFSAENILLQFGAVPAFYVNCLGWEGRSLPVCFTSHLLI